MAIVFGRDSNLGVSRLGPRDLNAHGRKLHVLAPFSHYPEAALSKLKCHALCIGPRSPLVMHAGPPPKIAHTRGV